MARRRYTWSLELGLPLLGITYYLLVRPQIRRAGTRPGEAEREMPGDELITAPNFELTRAVDIAAPPEVVWPWIAQMGRDHSGFYDMGVSIAYLRRDLPPPHAGDSLDKGYRILAVEEGKMLLYGGFDLRTPTGEATERTTVLLLERGTGSTGSKTRLLARTRGYTYGLFGPIYNLGYEVLDYLNGSAQLANIRQRAETLARLQSSER